MAQGSIIVRELIAMLGFELDEDALDEWDARVTGIARDVATTVAAMGTAVVGAAAAATQELISMGDELGDAAARTGVSARELLEWDYVARLSGTSTEALQATLSRLPGVMDRVASGNRAARETFGQLGVSVTNADGSMRSSGDVLEDLIGGLGRIENPTQRAAMATRVFGRRGAELAGLMARGADGVADLRREVRSLYGSELEGFVEAAGRAADEEERLTELARSLAIRIGSHVLPVVADLLERAVEMGSDFMEAARGVNLARVALIALTGIMAGAAAAAGVLALSTIEIWGPAVLVMGLVAAAAIGLGLAIDDILTFLDGGDSVVGAFLTELLGMEGAKSIIETVNRLVAQLRSDFEKLVSVWSGQGGGALVTDLLGAWVAQIGLFLGGLLLIITGTVHWARVVSEMLVSAWNSAKESFDAFMSRVTSGLAEARSLIEGVSGYLGIDVTGRGASGGAAKASPAAVTATPSSSTRSSTRTVSIGDIVVNGAADPGAVASEVHSRISAFFDDEADAARDDLVPEAA